MALKKVSKKSGTGLKSLFSKQDYEKMAREYADISSQIKALDARKKTLADNLKAGAESFGVKDDKGSFYLESDNFVVGKVASKSMKIDQQKAVEVLEEKGLEDCVTVVTTKTVDEERLEQAVASNKITLDEVEDFTKITTSYKVSVKEKEAVPEVEQSLLSVAKKK